MLMENRKSPPLPPPPPPPPPPTHTHTHLERGTLCFRSCKNHKLKIKLCWVGAPERKKSCKVYFFQRKSFQHFFLSQCIE